MLLSCTEQESNQRMRHRRGATQMRPLLCTSPAASPASIQKCSDFCMLTFQNVVSFLFVDARKSEHFRVSDGDAAGGVHRGGWCSAQQIIKYNDCRWQSYHNSCIFVAPPLCRLLLVLFLPVKKRTLTHDR